jgi:hypothetical protein
MHEPTMNASSLATALVGGFVRNRGKLPQSDVLEGSKSIRPCVLYCLHETPRWTLRALSLGGRNLETILREAYVYAVCFLVL